MEAVSLGMLRVRGAIELDSVHEYSSTEKVNEQTRVTIRGRLKKAFLKDMGRRRLVGEKISVHYTAEAQEKLVFCGVVVGARYDEKNNWLEIQCMGLESLLDRDKKVRSFQKMGITYRDIVSSVMKNQGQVIYEASEEAPLHSPVIQYRETDWEFLRRMGSYMGAILFPIAATPKLKLSFGFRGQEGKCIDRVFRETMTIDNLRYLRHRRQLSRGRFISLELVTDQPFELGDRIFYQGKDWRMMEKKTETVQSMLQFRYILAQPAAYRPARYGNASLKGCSLRGRVREVEGEKLRLQLEMGSGMDERQTYFYPYMPASGNVMYAMPETGEYVDLYFPNEFEENGFVIHGIAGKEGRKEENKFLRTPENKNFALRPYGIKLKSRNMESDSLSSIDMTDDASILVQSRQNVTMEAKGKIKFKCGQSSMIMAENFILLRQRGSVNQILMSGNEIISEAERYKFLSKRLKHRTAPRRRGQRAAFQGIENNIKLLGAFRQGSGSSLQRQVMAAMPACIFPGSAKIQNSIGLRGGGRS